MHWQFAFQVSLPVFALPSLHEVPGKCRSVRHAQAIEGDRRSSALAVRVPGIVDRVRVAVVAGGAGQVRFRSATPKQSKVTGVPAHWQFALHTSLIVFALLSLHEVPGKCRSVRHAQAIEGDRRSGALAVRAPHIVDRVRVAVVARGAGKAVPFAAPWQSKVTACRRTGSSRSRHRCSCSRCCRCTRCRASAVPFATPKQSKVTGVPAHWQFALHTSLIVFALPSLQEVPGKALPPGVPWQSIT